MKRFREIVLKAPNGYTFVAFETDSGKMIIKLIPTDATGYSGNYTDPPISEGWEHVEGEWNDGFVIQDSKGNQFVWVPVGVLDANGTLDGTNFSEKFGRRNYNDDEFSDDYKFREKLDEELRKQWESVQKYGGFYISRYNISRNQKTGDAQSVKCEMPWTKINWFDAMKVAKTFGDGDLVKSHLLYGAEYDSVLEWFIKSQARTEYEIASNSTQWGNFCNIRNAPRKVVKTGTLEEWSTNHIYDLAGNIDEWTQEKNMSSAHVIRGGYCKVYGNCYPVTFRSYLDSGDYSDHTGFRAALFLV